MFPSLSYVPYTLSDILTGPGALLSSEPFDFPCSILESSLNIRRSRLNTSSFKLFDWLVKDTPDTTETTDTGPIQDDSFPHSEVIEERTEDLVVTTRDEHKIRSVIERLCQDLGLEVQDLLTLAEELFADEEEVTDGNHSRTTTSQEG